MDDSLHYLIMANQMLVQKALLYKLKDTGLTIGQPKILDYLSRHNGSNQKEIAKACFLEAGSLTTILNKMEEKGLIRRQILNGNRRSFHIFMTELRSLDICSVVEARHVRTEFTLLQWELWQLTFSARARQTVL